MTSNLKPWDSATHLRTQEDMVLYLNACLDEAGNDSVFIAKAILNIARARGLEPLASDAGIGNGDPNFAAVLKVLQALGMKLHVLPITH